LHFIEFLLQKRPYERGGNKGHLKEKAARKQDWKNVEPRAIDVKIDLSNGPFTGDTGLNFVGKGKGTTEKESPKKHQEERSRRVS